MGAGPHYMTPLNFVLMSDDFKSEKPSVVELVYFQPKRRENVFFYRRR